MSTSGAGQDPRTGDPVGRYSTEGRTGHVVPVFSIRPFEDLAPLFPACHHVYAEQSQFEKAMDQARVAVVVLPQHTEPRVVEWLRRIITENPATAVVCVCPFDHRIARQLILVRPDDVVWWPLEKREVARRLAQLVDPSPRRLLVRIGKSSECLPLITRIVVNRICRIHSPPLTTIADTAAAVNASETKLRNDWRRDLPTWRPKEFADAILWLRAADLAARGKSHVEPFGI